ncbi:hypothetical protein Tco_0925776 [Tanacetum coccineum]|uniref:Reverse transcriptase n=1 Tax=Tanacetum coccineum TaxID=301880 RepID=A0ABQ5DAF5_9ASTR
MALTRTLVRPPLPCFGYVTASWWTCEIRGAHRLAHVFSRPTACAFSSVYRANTSVAFAGSSAVSLSRTRYALRESSAPSPRVSPPERPKDKTGLDASAKLTRAKLNKRSGDADLSKEKLGPESPLEFQRSWYVEGHIRSRVISSVLIQRYLRANRQRFNPREGPQSLLGDEGLCSGGTKLNTIFTTTEGATTRDVGMETHEGHTEPVLQTQKTPSPSPAFIKENIDILRTMIKEHDQQAKMKATPRKLAYADSDKEAPVGSLAKGFSDRFSLESSGTSDTHRQTRSTIKSQKTPSKNKEPIQEGLEGPSLGEKWPLGRQKWSVLPKRTNDTFARHGPEDLKEQEIGAALGKHEGIWGCTLLIPGKILSPRLPRLLEKSSPWKAGHNTNDCYQLKKQIEEAVASGKLAHLVKDIRRNNQRNGNQGRNDVKVINMIREEGNRKRPFEEGRSVEVRQKSCMSTDSENSMSTSGQDSDDRFFERNIPPPGGSWKEIQWRQHEEKMSRIREQVILRSKGNPERRPTSDTMSLGRTRNKEGTEEVFTISQERPNQYVTMGATLTTNCKQLLADVMRENMERRPIAPEGRLALKEKVFRWLREGLIRKVLHPEWITNAIPIKLTNGTWKVQIDYSGLNKACAKFMYPFPEEGENLASLMGYSYKCFLQLPKEYSQIRMAEEDKEKTGFHTEERYMFHPHAKRIKELRCYTSEDDGKSLNRSKSTERGNILERNSNKKKK